MYIYIFIISSTVILAADWSIAVGYWIVFHCLSINGNVRIRIHVSYPHSQIEAPTLNVISHSQIEDPKIFRKKKNQNFSKKKFSIFFQKKKIQYFFKKKKFNIFQKKIKIFQKKKKKKFKKKKNSKIFQHFFKEFLFRN